MKDPDEQPKDDAFDEVLRLLPPEYLERSIQETFKEMHTEAVSGVPTPLWLPPEVQDRVLAYEKEHSLDRNGLIPAAMTAQNGRFRKVIKAVHRLREDPDSFKWPVRDPLLCVAIAFMRSCLNWWIKKVCQEYGADDELDDDDQADWWKDDDPI
jgi:hypothetical protein